MINLPKSIEYLIKHKNYTEEQLLDMSIEEVMPILTKNIIKDINKITGETDEKM